MPQQTTTAELAALRAELAAPAAAASRAAPAPAERRPAEQSFAQPSESELRIEEFLQELQSVVNDVAAGAEGLIAEHPLPSVSAAFLLGVSVGWITARGLGS